MKINSNFVIENIDSIEEYIEEYASFLTTLDDDNFQLRENYTSDFGVKFKLHYISEDNENYASYCKILGDDYRYLFSKTEDNTLKKTIILILIDMEYVVGKTVDLTIQRLATFINNFLLSSELVNLSFGKSRFKLDGRKIFTKFSSDKEWELLKYEGVKALELMELLPSDLYGYEIDKLVLYTAHPNFIELNWKLFCESINHFMRGSYREVFINCCTAIEIIVSPAVETWLLSKTQTKPKKKTEVAVRDLGNPVRFEIYFSVVNPEIFALLTNEEKIDLLNGLKGMNTLRNKVVHQGLNPKVQDTIRAIQNTGKFLKLLWKFKNIEIAEKSNVTCCDND